MRELKSVELRRVSQLDGLRGIAILMVFFYHAFNVPVFWSGVDLFFVLSGYLITGVLLHLKERHSMGGESRSGAWRIFYLRRARRIFPPYVGFLLTVSLVYAVPWAKIWYFYLFFGANVATLLYKLQFVAMIPLWSLAVEEQFYFVWPTVVFWVPSATLKKVALGLCVIVPVLRAICTLFVSTHEAIYFLTPFRVDTLACGAFIAVAQHENREWIQLHRLLAARCAIAAAVIFCVLSVSARFRLTANSMLFNGVGYSLITVIFGGALIYVLASQDGLVWTVLTRKPLRYMGLISYTFYLYHLGVLSLLHQHVQSKVLAALLGFGISGTIAAISWWFLEAPVLGVARRLRIENHGGMTIELARAAATKG
jgi:peptidoglycan/LPS O-acetylase OafA/YrhL